MQVTYLIVGVMVVDIEHDIWEDWNDKSSFREEHKDEFPEGFVWTCCDAQGDVKTGCKISKHKVAKLSSKKPKNGESISHW